MILRVFVRNYTQRLNQCCSCTYAAPKKIKVGDDVKHRTNFLPVNLIASRHVNILAVHKHNTLNLVTRRYKSDVASGTNDVPGTITSSTSSTNSALDNYIPEPPSLADASSSLDQLTSIGEPSLSSLGLCSYWPPGWIQSLLEFLHVTGDIPWWATFAILSVTLRVALLPLQVLAIKYSTEQQAIMPVYMELQKELKRAVVRQDMLEAARLNNKLQAFLKEKNPKFWKSYIGLAYQIPVFFSALSAIRGMCNLPVEALKTGGILWFTDLTSADPIYMLPILTGATLVLYLELGAEGLRAATLDKNTRYAMRGFCALIPLLMMWQPCALNIYWFTSNAVALTVSSIIRHPSVKKAVGIPESPPPPKKPKSKEGFIAGIKRNFRETQIESVIKQQEGANAREFSDASRAKIVKTFKYDPTKVKSKVKEI